MKEVKFDTGHKKTADAFFDENLHNYSPLQLFVNSADLSEIKADKYFETDEKRFAGYLRQARLFFPGTFLLFFISLGTTLAVTDPFSRNVFFSPLFFLIYTVGLLSVFTTWFGLGDIKNRRHFVIPASIIVSGIIIGAIARASAGFFWISERIIDDFGYAVYLFPVGLIAPVLAKGWVDRKSE